MDDGTRLDVDQDARELLAFDALEQKEVVEERAELRGALSSETKVFLRANGEGLTVEEVEEALEATERSAQFVGHPCEKPASLTLKDGGDRLPRVLARHVFCGTSTACWRVHFEGRLMVSFEVGVGGVIHGDGNTANGTFVQVLELPRYRSLPCSEPPNRSAERGILRERPWRKRGRELTKARCTCESSGRATRQF